MTDTILELAGVDAGYGDVQVLHGVDMRVKAGEAVCLIGSNGAGKSTLLNTISGLTTLCAGAIRMHGVDMASASPRARVEAGIVQVPEGRRLFAGMSVKENLLMGAFLRRDGHAAIRRDLELVFETFPRLAERSRQDASTMSGGEQQMCAVGRGFMAKPKLLMIDELSLGLAPKVVDEIGAALRAISAAGVSLLIVEQDVVIALELTQYGLVLDEGRMRLQGRSADLLVNPQVREAYLGFEHEAIGTAEMMEAG